MRWGILLLCLLAAFEACALDPGRSLYQYNCRTWTRQSGLPANAVSSIVQTKDGYIWLGTPMGLVRFDGVEYKLFALNQLRSSIVSGLSASQSGGLWFGLESGAFGFCDGTGISFRGRTEWGGSNLTVHAILESREGDVWIAAQNLALKLTHGTDLVPILNTPGGRDFYDVGVVYQDSQGRVWLGTTARGLYYWQNGKLNRFPDPEVDKLTIRSLVEDQQGQIWIGNERGLLCYDANFKRKSIPLAGYETCALMADREGAVWAGTSSGGVLRYLNGGCMQLMKTNGLADDYVLALTEDREGNVWVGTRNGLSQISDVKIPTLGPSEGLTAPVNISVAPSRRGGLWIATSDGFTYFDRQAVHDGSDADLRSRYVKRVFEARNGDLYTISAAMDIEVFSGGHLVACYTNTSWPTAFTEDDQSVIVAMNGDLYRVGTNFYQRYTYPNGPPPHKCWTFNLMRAHDGAIWTATAEGICRVKDGAAEILTGPDPLGGCKAGWICEDNEGVIWGGMDIGMARIKNGQVRIISRKDGLFDNLIYAIVPDDYGSLWVAASRGFFRVSRKSLNDFADGKASRVDCTAYDGLEAVKTFERNQQEPSGCKTLDGRIWFPTAQGVVVINPTNIPTDSVPPAVFVNQTRVNGKDLTQTNPAAVPVGTGDLEFHYTALSYRAPQKIHFRYRLEGYDPDWVDAGERRLAHYANLSPGRYTFSVNACNADGVWNNFGDSVQIQLLPNFYQTSWFRVLGGAAVIGAIIGGYRWRLRHLTRRQLALQQSRDMLEHRVEERTRELAESNQSLKNEIEERKRMEVEVEHVHQQLLDASHAAGQAQVASSVLHNVGNVLNSVNVSINLIKTHLGRLSSTNLEKAVEMIHDHADDLANFLTRDEKGRHFPRYLKEVSQHLGGEQQYLLKEVKELRQNVEHIKEIVAMQQAYANVSGLLENVVVSEIVDSAIKMTTGEFSRHAVTIIRDYQPVDMLLADKHRLLQILGNILANAKYACVESGRPDKTVTVRIQQTEKQAVRIEITDNGIGIAPENMKRLFTHGFTTRKNGHGFGLHSAALATSEMKGTLNVHSDGPGRGASFILELPLQPPASTGREPSRDARRIVI